METDRLDIFLHDYCGWCFKVSRSMSYQTSELTMPKEKRPSDSSDDAYDNDREIFYYPQRRIQRAGAVISVLFSAILLIGAIVCLLLVSDRSINIRVALIVLFTSLFALVVGLLTNARRAEIFGATAA